MVAHRICADRADQTDVVPGRAEPACHVGRTSPDAPSQRLGIYMVAGGGDARNTQDDVRRNDAEHNDLSHAHWPCLPLAATRNQRPCTIIIPALSCPLPAI